MNYEKNIKKENKNGKKKSISWLLMLFFLFLTGFVFIWSNPQVENILIAFRSSSYEADEVLELNLDEMTKVNKIFSLKEGWGIHLLESTNERIIFINDKLYQKDERVLESGSDIIKNTSTHDYWLVNDSDRILTFDRKGEKISSIELDEWKLISKDEVGILLGKNKIKTEESLKYIEELKWLDKEGELIKELSFENLMVLKGINNDDLNEKYLVMTFSENPQFKLVKKNELREREKRILDLNPVDVSKLFVNRRGSVLIIGNERNLILLKDQKRDVFEPEGNKIILDVYLLDNEIALIVTGDEENSSKNLTLSSLSQGEFDIFEQRPLRGSVIGLREKDDGELIISTTSHLYFYRDDNFKVFQNPWEKISYGALDNNGSNFLTFNEDLGQLILYKKEKNDD